MGLTPVRRPEAPLLVAERRPAREPHEAPPPRALLIDLDGTLLDDTWATAKAFRAFCNAHEELAGQSVLDLLARWQALMQHHWARFERGEVDFPGQRRDRVRDFLGRNLADGAADAAFEPYSRTYEQSWRLYPDVPAFLERTQHLPRVIVTNGTAQQQGRKVRATGLEGQVLAVVTPDDCGSWKPDPGIFEAAVRLAGVAPAECMMVGDDPVRDIAPAHALGLRGYHVDRQARRGLDGVPAG